MEPNEDYEFTGKEGAFLGRGVLKKWIKRHKEHHEVRAHFFGKEILKAILKQPGCMGIRFHHAIDDKGQKTLVIVGANAKGEDLWSTSTGGGKLKDGGSTAGDASFPCPPYC